MPRRPADDSAYDAVVSTRIRADDRDRLLALMGTTHASTAIRKLVELAVSAGTNDRDTIADSLKQ